MPIAAAHRAVLAAIALSPLVVLSACNRHATNDVKLVELDGAMTEWPADVAQWSDEKYLYLRVAPPEPVTLQASAEPLVLYLDVDGDALTGVSPPRVAQDRSSVAMGADLMVVFSPGAAFPQLTDKRTGVTAAALYRDGSMRHLSHADLDFSFSPTYAAPSYEMRISRGALACATGEPVSLANVASRFVLMNAAGEAVGASDVAVGAPGVPGMGAENVFGAGELVRPGQGDTLRIVSWNIERGGPNTRPEPYRHVLSALAPDVVLVQEWEDATSEQLQAWFNENLPWGGPWHAITSAGWGVAVISRYPLDRLGPQRLERPSNAPPDAWRSDRDVATRFTGAVVRTPIGAVAVASVHLKCCGSMGSPEDLARIAEARLIRDTFASAADERGIALRVIAGDFNLVGSRTPLEELSAAGDADGTPMLAATPRVLGDNTYVTWSDEKSNFSPGRLDWMLVGDSALAIERSFVLDTARLGRGVLREAGLQERDSRTSDHMPIVADLAPVR